MFLSIQKNFFVGDIFNRESLDKVNFLQKMTEIRIKGRALRPCLFNFLLALFASIILRLLNHAYGIIAFKIDICTIVEDFASYC
jgi:hypothetical protein